MGKNRKFLIMKDCYLGIKSGYNVTMFRPIKTEECSWLELDDEGHLCLVSDMGRTKYSVEYSGDLLKPGIFKELVTREAAAGEA